MHVQYCHTLPNMSSSLMRCLLIVHLIAGIKSASTCIEDCGQPMNFKMPISQVKIQNPVYTPQIKQYPFTKDSGEKSKVSPTKVIVVDQDMVDWFNELFGEEQLSPPHFVPLPVPPPPFLDTLTTTSSEFVPAGIEPRSYSLRDTDQKGLYLQKKNLVAAPLQEDSSAQEEILSVLPNRSLDRQRIPLILGVKGGSQGISCGKEEEPKLQLEDTDLRYLFTNDEEAKRFTFFKSYNGSTHSFESATHPGWYLSSPVEAHKPLMFTNHLGEAAITDFYFYRK